MIEIKIDELNSFTKFALHALVDANLNKDLAKRIIDVEAEANKPYTEPMSFEVFYSNIRQRIDEAKIRVGEKE